MKNGWVFNFCIVIFYGLVVNLFLSVLKEIKMKWKREKPEHAGIPMRNLHASISLFNVGGNGFPQFSCLHEQFFSSFILFKSCDSITLTHGIWFAFGMLQSLPRIVKEITIHDKYHFKINKLHAYCWEYLLSTTLLNECALAFSIVLGHRFRYKRRGNHNFTFFLW